MNLLAQASELLLLLYEPNLIHVRQIQSVQVAASGADASDQSDQDGRVRGPLGIGISAGAACLQFELIDFERAQLKLQFGQIRRLAGEELCVG